MCISIPVPVHRGGNDLHPQIPAKHCRFHESDPWKLQSFFDLQNPKIRGDLPHMVSWNRGNPLNHPFQIGIEIHDLWAPSGDFGSEVTFRTGTPQQVTAAPAPQLDSQDSQPSGRTELSKVSKVPLQNLRFHQHAVWKSSPSSVKIGYPKNSFNGLTKNDKSSPETIDFPMKYGILL